MARQDYFYPHGQQTVKMNLFDCLFGKARPKHISGVEDMDNSTEPYLDDHWTVDHEAEDDRDDDWEEEQERDWGDDWGEY